MFITIYFVLCVILLIDVFKTRINLMSLAKLSFIFYTSSCLLGNVWIERGIGDVYYSSQIGSKTYLLIYLQMLIFIVFAKVSIFNIKIKHNKKLFVTDNNFISNIDLRCLDIISIISIIIFLYNIYFTVGFNNILSGAHKSDIINQTNFLFSFSIWGILISFVYSFKYSKKNILFLSSICLLVILLIGIRSYPVIAILCVVIIKSNEVKKILKNNLKWFIIIFILFVFAMVYKEIYRYVRLMDIDKIIETILNYNIFEDILSNPESRITFTLYDYVVSNNYKISLYDSLIRLFSLIPGVNNIFQSDLPIRFSEIARDILFGTSYGLGGSFWGETYAMFGTIGVIIVTYIWIKIIKYGDKLLLSNNKYYCFFSIILIYISFYIHRLDWVQVFGGVKSIIFWFVIYCFLKILIRRKL